MKHYIRFILILVLAMYLSMLLNAQAEKNNDVLSVSSHDVQIEKKPDEAIKSQMKNRDFHSVYVARKILHMESTGSNAEGYIGPKKIKLLVNLMLIYLFISIILFTLGFIVGCLRCCTLLFDVFSS